MIESALAMHSLLDRALLHDGEHGKEQINPVTPPNRIIIATVDEHNDELRCTLETKSPTLGTRGTLSTSRASIEVRGNRTLPLADGELHDTHYAPPPPRHSQHLRKPEFHSWTVFVKPSVEILESLHRRHCAYSIYTLQRASIVGIPCVVHSLHCTLHKPISHAAVKDDANTKAPDCG